ncbi:hypothetical protein PR003_g11399 [Phytophthora rubi]|uniref:Uncharacterized protein n=1 Tax=Phytophthora rubi TaxID=129364 RepID=A0A6A4FGH0_9STRA|nr:hypothetical protein PR003_g11399 [Phytophthora rubi]
MEPATLANPTGPSSDSKNHPTREFAGLREGGIRAERTRLETTAPDGPVEALSTTSLERNYRWHALRAKVLRHTAMLECCGCHSTLLGASNEPAESLAVQSVSEKPMLLIAGCRSSLRARGYD